MYTQKSNSVHYGTVYILSQNTFSNLEDFQCFAGNLTLDHRYFLHLPLCKWILEFRKINILSVKRELVSFNAYIDLPIIRDAKINEKGPELTLNLLVDIYGVHKALIFGQLQRADYQLSVFEENLEEAESKVLRADDFSQIVAENAEMFSISFYPLYLVNDDIFGVMACHFAVSLVVNRMAKTLEEAKGLHIRSVVVPAVISSRYDLEDEYSPTIKNVAHYLFNICSSNPRLVATQRIDTDIASISKMASIITKLITEIRPKSLGNIAVIFNRQKSEKSDSTTVTVFECMDWSEINELKKNYFISFDFEVFGVDNNVSNEDGVDEHAVRCWMTFGVGQRLRFYPEYVLWIVPFLFVRSTTMTTYKLIQRLYGDDYKHGWRVNLDDPTFNKYYHIITGYEHISNNYNRNEVEMKKSYIDDDVSGLRDHLESTLGSDYFPISSEMVDEEAYDSDAILHDVLNKKRQFEVTDSNIMPLMSGKRADLQRFKFAIFRFEKVECKSDVVHRVDECQHIESVIQNLQKFEECDLEIDALNVIDFNLESIINGFDHMVRVHDFLSDDAKKMEIQNYIAGRVVCNNGPDCGVLAKHSNRCRERESAEQKEMDPLHEVDALCDATSDALQSVHCYVLHQNNHLYRLLSGRNNKFQSRFGTVAVKVQQTIDEEAMDDQKDDEKEDEEPLGIDFGLSVLKWLPFGQKPHHQTLREELLGNPHSTIDRALLSHYVMLCAAMIKGTNFTENEMLCLKLYSDTTDLQGRLRRAHWESTPLSVRQMYYHWALGLYRTFLYHAMPIPTATNSNTKPCKLYHGLSRLFTMSREMPVYNGPFSTTIAKSVASTFCKNNGLIWLIQPTYANPLRFCIGIVMEWISCFKHEREVLLYNQTLPIQKTETFDDDPSVLVEHLMYSLINRATAILGSDSFWNQLGIQFQDEWIPLIMDHKLLNQPSKFNNITIIERLREELDIKFFKLFKMVNDSVTMTENEMVTLRDGDQFESDLVSKYSFGVGLGITPSSNLEQRNFDEIQNFTIPCIYGFHSEVNSLKFTIFCKAADDTFGFVPVHSMILQRYHFTRNTPLMLTESVKIPSRDMKQTQNGSLVIRTTSDIDIDANTIIDGSGAAENSKGATVRVIATGSVIINGSIVCNGLEDGRGGTIYIVGDMVINEGSLECDPRGEITIFCREFINNGVANPQSMLIVIGHNGRKQETAPNALPDGYLNVIDYFLDSVHREFANPDLDSNTFYRKIGVKMESEWIPIIAQHGMLQKQIPIKRNQRNNVMADRLDFLLRDRSIAVIDVLAYRFDYGFFKMMRMVIASAIITDDDILKLKDVRGDDGASERELISKYIFRVGLGMSMSPNSEPQRFDDKKQFAIPCIDALNSDADSLKLTIFAKPDDDSMDFVPIHSMVLQRYHFSAKTPLVITESIGIQNGTLLIQNMSDVVIAPQCTLNGCGVAKHSVGGTVRLISSDTVTNKGTVSCNATSSRGENGVIYVVADTVINDGTLECEHRNDDGQETFGGIKIFCREYINNGVVSPPPMLVWTGGVGDQRNHQETTDVLFGDDRFIAIEYLLHSIHSEFGLQHNLNKDTFYRNIRLEMQSEWIPDIARHDMLYEEVYKDDQMHPIRVIDILADKLDVDYFSFFGIIKNSLVVDSTLSVVSKSQPFQKSTNKQHEDNSAALERISDYIFRVKCGDEVEQWQGSEYRFGTASEFKIDLQTASVVSNTPHIYAKPVDGTRSYFLLKSLQMTWQCPRCHHQNRRMMIGGEYKNPDVTMTECNLCYFDDDEVGKEIGDDGKRDDMKGEAHTAISEEIFSDFAIIGCSECRRLEHFDSGLMSFLLNQYVFESMNEAERQKLIKHKKAIAIHFKNQSIDGRIFRTQKNQIAKALSMELCGSDELVDAMTNGLFKVMDEIDWNQCDIPFIQHLPHCAAMDRIKFILQHFERWTIEAERDDNRYRVQITDFIEKLREQCRYSLYDLQHDLEHIFNEHQNFMQMAVIKQCERRDRCIHFRRNEQFSGGIDDTADSMKWFGTKSMDEVTEILILDRLHCMIKHYLNPNTSEERERAFNLFVVNVRNATTPQYDYGIQMKYHSLTPRHKNLITELRRNTMCPLNKEQVDRVVAIAISLKQNNKKVTKWKAKQSSPENGVLKGDGMHIEFIICLRIYHGFYKFCRKFRASFRKLKYGDNADVIRQRHIHSFYWFGRFLDCALTLYGRKPKRKQIFYYGLDGKFLFDSFSAVFEIPLSTTNDMSVAQRYTEDRGVILCFSLKFKQSQNSSYYLSISGSGLSVYNESEYLFAGGVNLAIINIIFVDDGRNYQEYIMCLLYWERILEQTKDNRNKYRYGVITKNNKERWMSAHRECLVPLIKHRMHLMAGNEQKNEIPLYVMRLFNHFCDQKSSINLSCIRMEMEFMEQSLREILFKEYAVDIDALSVILPNCKMYVNEDGEYVLISKRGLQ